MQISPGCLHQAVEPIVLGSELTQVTTPTPEGWASLKQQHREADGQKMAQPTPQRR